MISLIASLCVLLTCIRASIAEEIRKPATVTSLETTELADFNEQPEPIKSLIQAALKLTKLNLTYVYSSSDPKLGGMDCSGTIYHLLIKQGLKQTPRQSDEMGQWLQNNGTLKRTDQADSLSDAAFAALKPGDLIFWSGTYETTKRRLPITHVMLYLGKHKTTQKPVIFGASDGRSYEGQKRTGVSIFNLTMPKADSKVSIYGFGSVPGLMPANSISEPASLESTKPQSHPKEPKAE
jgi:cell wall-associated NlpC family hydrolase